MTICYFGDFDPEYARNKVIISGLRKNGVDVIFCHERSRGFKKYFNLARKLRALKNNYDFLIVGYSDSHWLTPLAKFLSHRKIVWDAFYSIYDSWVFDRGLVKPQSLKAAYYWFLDWLNCFLADQILLDTQEHINYFTSTFKTNKNKFVKVLIGADNELFYPHK